MKLFKGKREAFGRLAAGVMVAGALHGATASAALIEIDEYGNGIGTLGQGVLTSSPLGPPVLIYKLPFAGTAGDVGLDAAPPEGFSDVLRFNGDGTLQFYSSSGLGLGADSNADFSSPGIRLPNSLVIPEVGPEGPNGVGDNGAFYTPVAGQPGFDVSLPTYHFVSDGVVSMSVPEPVSAVLFGLGLAGLAAVRRKRA